MPLTVPRMSTISAPLASLTRRSGPMILTVFSPLTPDIASSTLSLIACEKLKMTPGNAVGELLRQLLGHALLGDAAAPLVVGLERREQLDVVEAGDVGAVVGAAELRDHRRDLGMVRCASSHFGGVDVAFGRARAAEQDGAHAADVLGRLLERDRRRQRGADPEVALLELGHELAPHRRGQQRRCRRPAPPPTTTAVAWCLMAKLKSGT